MQRSHLLAEADTLVAAFGLTVSVRLSDGDVVSTGPEAAEVGKTAPALEKLWH